VKLLHSKPFSHNHILECMRCFTFAILNLCGRTQLHQMSRVDDRTVARTDQNHRRHWKIITHHPPCGRGTVVLIVSCRCTYGCLETSHGKITRHYSRYCTVAFCYVHMCELSYICPGHDIKLHPHRVKLYRIGSVGSGLVLAKALT